MSFWRRWQPVMWTMISIAAAPVVFSDQSESRAGGAGEREFGGYFSQQRLAHARRNIARFSWAAELRDEAVRKAARWRAREDAALWALVPGQDLPRTIDVTLTRSPAGTTRQGCLSCGHAIDRFGSFPYEPEIERLDWKLTCPSCGSVFPTNDFGAYYRSGIDERGLFNPAKADRRLLFNTAHAAPDDPLRQFGVDDGFGYIDAAGNGHRFVGYFAWKYWRWLVEGVTSLADAYVYTGDAAYAHKAAVLLDRIADVYPEMDWKPYADRGWFHSDANRGVGKIEGAIWETNVARKLAESYDAILSGTVDDEALWAFLSQQAQRYRLPTAKGTRADFVRGCDERLLRTIYRGVLSGQIRGNEGMQQMAVASSALALNTNPETSAWLDWLFAPDGGAIPGLIVSQFDRDGGTDEAAPNYAPFAGQLFSRLAARLYGYPGYARADLWKPFPALAATFGLAARMPLLGRAVPNLGDSGATGLVSLAPADPKFCAQGFRFTGDPALAVLAYRLNGNSAAGLGRDVFEADPEATERAIARLGNAAGARPVGGQVMTGYGLAMLEAGPSTNQGWGLALNYGRTTRHGHADGLGFDLFGYGLWLAPDFGYPEFATNWPSRNEWTVNTLAHNTVMVDGRMQPRGWGGKLTLYRQLRGFGVVEVDGRASYPTLQAYDRTLALVETPGGNGAYVVDIFTVRGGRDHLWSFHGPPGPMTATGLNLVRQEQGTYAGETVAFAQSPGAFPVGFSYLYDVARQARPPEFAVDWQVEPGYRGAKAEDDVRVRLQVVGASDEAALAWGDPPQNKVGNPRRLGFVLLRRQASGVAELASTFVAVIEPYRRTPTVKSVKRLAAPEGQGGLQVELAGGETDLFFWSETGGRPVWQQGGMTFSGRIGWLRRAPTKEVQRAVLVEGTVLRAGAADLRGAAAITGHVEAMNRDLVGGGWIGLRADQPIDERVVGQTIRIENENERDACYVIERVESAGDHARIYCGAVSFVRDYASPTMTLRGQTVPAHYDGGFRHDFEIGARFTIPLHREWPTP